MNEADWTHILTLPGAVFAAQAREVLQDNGIAPLVKEDLLTGTYLVRGSDRAQIRIFVRPEEVRRACELLQGMFPGDAFTLPGYSEDAPTDDTNRESE